MRIACADELGVTSDFSWDVEGCAERAVCCGYVVFVAHVGTAAPFKRVFGDRVGIFIDCEFDVDASVCMCPIDVRREGDGLAIVVDDGDLAPVGI